MYNPWKTKCPRCRISLEGGKWQKISIILAVPVGLMISGVAIWQEEIGNWRTLDSVIWFGFSSSILLLILLLVCIPFWPKYTFKVKNDA